MSITPVLNTIITGDLTVDIGAWFDSGDAHHCRKSIEWNEAEKPLRGHK